MDLEDLSRIIAAKGMLIFRVEDDEGYKLLGQVPDWFRRISGEVAPNDLVEREGLVERFPFLEVFLEELDEFWSQAAEGEFVSDFWEEGDGDGGALHLRATGLREGGTKFFWIEHWDRDFKERFSILQQARENSLRLEKMVSEMNLKEVLLHCIVHDLGGPLAGMQGCFELLQEEEEMGESSRELLGLGRLEAVKQRNMIQDLMDVFREESGSSAIHPIEVKDLPDLIQCGKRVIEGLTPAYRMKRVRLEMDVQGMGEECRVVGEASKLERIFYNLLENALRHSMSGGEVWVRVVAGATGKIQVFVEDNGVGMDPAVAGKVFQKFIKGKGRTGKSGLGLFFCRITVERWGGGIGCEPREERGTRFWFELLPGR